MSYPNALDTDTTPGASIYPPQATQSPGALASPPIGPASPTLSQWLQRVADSLIGVETTLGLPASPAAGSIFDLLSKKLSDAPTDGKAYARESSAWTPAPAEAPTDGHIYVRQNGMWVPGAAGTSIQALYTFGDSIGAPDNVANFGDVWTCALGRYLNLPLSQHSSNPSNPTYQPGATNYNLSGTYAGPNNAAANGAGYVSQQVNNFLTAVGGTVPQNSAFCIFIYTNDAFYASAQGANLGNCVTDAVNGISNALSLLFAAGAPAVIVFKAYDIGLTPEGNGTAYWSAYQSIYTQFNSGLVGLQSTYPNLVLFDPEPIYQNFGGRYTNNANGIPSSDGPFANMLISRLMSVSYPGLDINRFAYNSGRHPSAPGARALAQALLPLVVSTYTVTTSLQTQLAQFGPGTEPFGRTVTQFYPRSDYAAASDFRLEAADSVSYNPQKTTRLFTDFDEGAVTPKYTWTVSKSAGGTATWQADARPYRMQGAVQLAAPNSADYYGQIIATPLACLTGAPSPYEYASFDMSCKVYLARSGLASTFTFGLIDGSNGNLAGATATPTVEIIDSGTGITLDVNTSRYRTVTQTLWVSSTNDIIVTGNTALNSNGVTGVSSTAGIAIGMYVSGNGVQTGARVISISGTTVSTTFPCTGNNTGATLTFSRFNYTGGNNFRLRMSKDHWEWQVILNGFAFPSFGTTADFMGVASGGMFAGFWLYNKAGAANTATAWVDYLSYIQDLDRTF